MMAAHSQSRWVGRYTVSKMLIPVVFLCLWASGSIAAQDPVTVVKTGTDQVLQLLKEHSGDTQTRRTKIRALVDQYFDFNALAKRALGPAWKGQPQEKQQQFTRDFSQLLFNTYITKIEKYTNERISYNQKQMQGDHAVVEALVVGGQAGKVTIEYYMHLVDGNWMVYDVAIEGVGLVTNYRSQFDEILSRSSFDDLLTQLKAKVAQR
ncbi:Toluene tolerance family protein [Syntrophobacter sp. SbD1]|nr:Toluene tolerance family protein [Syntrophobacter sp. SbD1]